MIHYEITNNFNNHFFFQLKTDALLDVCLIEYGPLSISLLPHEV